jgi:hypothetical protein
MKQCRLLTTHLQGNPTVQEPRKNEDGASLIPTIVNGVTNVKRNPKHNQEVSDPTSDSVSLLINNLRETIIVHKMKHPLSRKHRIIFVGASHVGGYVSTLKPLLNSDYDLYSVVKPGSGTSELYNYRAI